MSATNATSGAARFAWRGLHARIGIVHGAGEHAQAAQHGPRGLFRRAAEPRRARVRHRAVRPDPRRAHGGAGGPRVGVDPANHSPPSSGAEPAQGPPLLGGIPFPRAAASSSPSSPSRPSSAGGGGAGRDESCESRAAPFHAPRARDVHAETTTLLLRFAGRFDVVVRRDADARPARVVRAEGGVEQRGARAGVARDAARGARASSTLRRGSSTRRSFRAIPATSIADRRRLLLNQDHGWGGASGRWSSRAGGASPERAPRSCARVSEAEEERGAGVPADVADARLRARSKRAAWRVFVWGTPSPRSRTRCFCYRRRRGGGGRRGRRRERARKARPVRDSPPPPPSPPKPRPRRAGRSERRTRRAARTA